jgi:dTDP-4-amino-4,6-dideoxygalactose transaminase
VKWNGRSLEGLSAGRLVEDNAHGLFGNEGEEPGLGRPATLSFHETKNFTCGRGRGAADQRSRQQAGRDVRRKHGSIAVFAGEVDKYGWSTSAELRAVGSAAAVLFAQLEQRHEATSAAASEAYRRPPRLGGSQRRDAAVDAPSDIEPGYHLFYVLMGLARRDRLIAHLKQRGVMAVFHYMPLNLS